MAQGKTDTTSITINMAGMPKLERGNYLIIDSLDVSEVVQVIGVTPPKRIGWIKTWKLPFRWVYYHVTGFAPTHWFWWDGEPTIEVRRPRKTIGKGK